MEIRAVASVVLVLPTSDLTKAVVDLFTPEETPLCTLKKRPHLEDNDPTVVRQEAELIAMEQFEAARLGSITHERARQTRELERKRGDRPSRHAAETIEATKQVNSGQTQPETGT